MPTEIEKTTSEARALLAKLVHFTSLSNTEDENIPGVVLENLIQHVLLTSQVTSTVDIKQKIKDKHTLEFEIYEVQNVLDKMKESGRVVTLDRKNYSLEANCAKELRERIATKESLQKTFLEKLRADIHAKYPDVDSEGLNLVTEDFQTFLAMFFMLSGAEAINLLYGKGEQKVSFINRIANRDIWSFIPKRNGVLQAIERKEFVEFLNLASDQEKEYLQDILNKTLDFFAINVDKKCEALIQSNLKDWTLYVDTNFVYDLLALDTQNANRRKRHAAELLSICKQFNMTFVISPITLDEFRNSIRDASTFLKERLAVSLDYDQIDGYVSSPIIAAYYEAKKKHHITPAEFLAEFENIKIVLEAYGIKERLDYSKSIVDSEELEKLAHRMEKSTGKMPVIAKHDAFHILVVQKMREMSKSNPQSFVTNKYWFLTLDSMMPSFDKSFRGPDKISTCIHPYQLRQFLRPLTKRAENFEVVFTEFVSEPALRASSATPTSRAAQILSTIQYYEDKYGIENSSELATTLLIDGHLSREIKKLSKVGNEDEISKLINKEVETRIKDLIESSKQISPPVAVITPPGGNVKLYWVIGALLLIIYVGANCYLLTLTSFSAQLRGSLYFWGIDLIFFLLILTVPLGERRVLAFAKHIGKIYKAISKGE